MSFLEIVARAKAYLETQRRVSIRALRREFDLDDDTLDELVEELVDVQQVAASDGSVLSWIGAGSAGAPAPETGRTPAVSDPPRSADAEHRQLSVLFCDLVDSTALSSRLGAEAYREVVQAYQEAAAAAVIGFDGHVAQYLGDGVLAYLGYPRAHEDDPERAVRAALAVVHRVRALNDQLTQRHRVRIQVRAGVHTGPVVVGAMGDATRRETLATGETTNVAARLQALAEPDTVVISGKTMRLVQGVFVTEDLGEHVLKGLPAPLRVHRAVQPSGVRSRLEVAVATELTPFVGRDQELMLLEDRFAQAIEGRGHAVLIAGEAGIGKSRLIQAFRERLAERTHTWLECRGSPYMKESAFYPVLELHRQALGFRPEDPAATRLERIEAGLAAVGFDPAEMAPVAAALHGVPLGGRFPAPNLPGDDLRRKTLRLLVEWLLRLGQRQPLVLLLDDLHWMDPSTLELVGGILDQLPTASILLLATYRPDFEPAWPARGYLTPMLISRLAPPLLANLVRRAARGRHLPEAWVGEILRRADGVPLFAEELTKAVLEAHPAPPAAGEPAPALNIPETLQGSLMGRLDALGPVKVLAQVGSVLGREFPYELLLEVSPMKEEELQAALRAAVRGEILYQRGTPPDATYLFKHALIRDIAYGSLLQSRRVELHAAIAAALERVFPDLAASEPERLAYHHTEAGQMRAAIARWHEAARLSLRRSASKEATLQLKRALALLVAQPASRERDREELDLQVDLGSATMMSHGWGSPEGARCYARARDLCLAVGDERELFPILWGFWFIHQARGERAASREIAAELLAIAERHHDPGMLVQAHHASWGNPFLGDFVSQLEHVERGLSYYDPIAHSRLALQYGGHDAGVCALAHRGFALWATGHPERSGESFAAALALADEIGHPSTKLHALALSAWLPVFRSDWPEAFRAADAGMRAGIDLGSPNWMQVVAVVRGCALVALGEVGNGLAQIRGTLESGDLAGAIGLVTARVIYAEALHLTGATDEALATLDEVLPLMERTGEAFWKANAMALKGDLLLARGLHRDAEVWYRTAIDVAHAQTAKMWELRAATRLARLWHLQGKTVEARDFLAPIYGWFTEGFDTRDLKDAQALLADLGLEQIEKVRP